MQRAVMGYAVALRDRLRRSASSSPRQASLRAGGRLADHRPADDAVDRLVPAAIVLFGLNESAILFVVVLGAAPAIANGLIAGIDQIPPVLLRAGRVLGRQAVSTLYRHVILPAALPASSAASSRAGPSPGAA